MYIKRIVLENFQSFEKADFNLSPNLNILVGISNVGKSSVARALSLILFNQWDKSWVKFGAKSCRVTITTNTGISVIREKGEKVNKYILFYEGASATTYESFGTTVPEPIQQALKIHTVPIDTTDTLNLNLVGQMDALFLLSQTGSYRAKVLGKLSGATYLDHAIRKLNNDKRQATAEKDGKSKEITDLQKEVDKFGAIEAYAETISALESTLTSLTRSQERVESIRNLLERVKDLRDSWTRANQKDEILGTLELNSISALSGKVDNIKAISNLLTKVHNFKRDYLQEDKLQELLKPIDSSGITVLADRVSKLKTLKDLHARVSKNSTDLENKAGELQNITQQHGEADGQYKEMLRKNGICPFCNQPTNVCVQ